MRGSDQWLGLRLVARGGLPNEFRRPQAYVQTTVFRFEQDLGGRAIRGVEVPSLRMNGTRRAGMTPNFRYCAPHEESCRGSGMRPSRVGFRLRLGEHSVQEDTDGCQPEHGDQGDSFAIMTPHGRSQARDDLTETLAHVLRRRRRFDHRSLVGHTCVDL